MRILLVEDDHRLARLIVRMLKKEFYTVDWIDNGEDAYECAKTIHYDLLILDWMLPKKSGVEVSRLLHEEGHQVPVLMLTARDGVDDLVHGLDNGADDYLVKPFEFKELFARIRALSRRKSWEIEKNTFPLDDLEVDPNRHVLIRDGETIPLTPKEFQLVELLSRNRNHVLSKDLIIERVWGMDSEGSYNTVETFIKLLRKKLDPTGKKNYIKTVRGVGYVIEDPDV